MPDTINGTIRWSGEHWINYICRSGEDTDSGSLSLYHTYYGDAGAGTVAFVDIPDAGFTAMLANNRELADWTFDQMIRGRGKQFDRELPVLDASFKRGGDIRTNPSWTIEADSHTIESTWNITEPATIHWGPTPAGIPNVQIFSLLFFTHDVDLAHNGNPVEGTPYTRDIWRPTIGGDRSSCVFALAETTIYLEA